jgi:multicomponent K+:H+ antiporter subunit D
MADLALKIPLVPEADAACCMPVRHSRGGLPGQGRDVAAELLAGAGLFLGQRAGGGDVRDHDQGRRLHPAAPVDLLFSGQAGASAYFGGDWLIYGGMATIVCAAMAILAAQRLERMASLSILVSAGILLSAIGFAQPT